LSKFKGRKKGGYYISNGANVIRFKEPEKLMENISKSVTKRINLQTKEQKMKFEVYKENSERAIYLKLVKVGGSVILKACASDGTTLKGGFLLQITERGDIKRYTGVTEDYGFNLTKEGKLVIQD